MIRRYCDACKSEMDMHTIRPTIRIEITSPIDGSNLSIIEFCDACYMAFKEAITHVIAEGF